MKSRNPPQTTWRGRLRRLKLPPLPLQIALLWRLEVRRGVKDDGLREFEQIVGEACVMCAVDSAGVCVTNEIGSVNNLQEVLVAKVSLTFCCSGSTFSYKCEQLPDFQILRGSRILEDLTPVLATFRKNNFKQGYSRDGVVGHVIVE